MLPARLRFDPFVLDVAERRLWRGDEPVEINARYLDALALLAGEAGKLIAKERFLDEVWRGVPVTDEALTQCIRTLRRALRDDAARPRFIETVPKHGYRFVSSVEREDAVPASTLTANPSGWRELLLQSGAGTLGAGVAGAIGGLAYGFLAASRLDGGGLSVLLVLLWLTIAIAMIGGAGVSLGITLAGRAKRRPWLIMGGAAGGLIVGGAVKLMGIDAFTLLLGRSPGNITGAPEGLLLGGSVGLGAWLVEQRAVCKSFRRQIAGASLAGGIGAVLTVLAGGVLMGGSLDLLAHQFPGSRLHLYSVGSPPGVLGLGALSRLASAAMEGMLFGGGIIGAMLRARGRPGKPDKRLAHAGSRA